MLFSKSRLPPPSERGERLAVAIDPALQIPITLGWC
jgi:hypothetical protein